MEINELVREIVLEKLDDDKIERILSHQVYCRMQEYAIEKAIKDAADRIVNEKAGNYLQEEVDRVINGNKIRIDNGWGDVQEYGSFDEFVRTKIASELRSSWKIENKIREACWDRLKKTVDAIKKKYLDVLSENLVADLKDELEEMKKKNAG